MKHLFLAIAAFAVLGLAGEYAISKYNNQTMNQVSAIQSESDQSSATSNESTYWISGTNSNPDSTSSQVNSPVVLEQL